MQRAFMTAAIVLLTSSIAQAQTVVGDWLGALKVGAVELRLALHVTQDAGGLKATMDSLDQGAKGIPVSSISLKGATLTFRIDAIQGRYEGTLSSDGSAIEGTWTQGQSSLLAFRRVKDTSELVGKRPQNPTRPYPYRDEEVAYASRNSPNVRLAATLTIPAGQGPFPAVVLITGSGPQDRDESLLGHRPFLVLADYLTRHGIAVLRADDRGFGKSTGNFATATNTDFAEDAEAGVTFLLTRPEVDKGKIGLVGHSEGGLVAPMVAARNPSVAFIVMLAGPGVPGEQIILEQSRLIATASGVPQQQIDQNAVEMREILTLVKQATSESALQATLRQKLTGKLPPPQLDAQVRTMSSPWYRALLAYDPAPVLSKVACPVLALNGEKDLQVPPKVNLPAIEKALAAGGNKRIEVAEMPGLNHLFQTATTGAPVEYGQIEETMAPALLDRVTRWILSQ